MWNIFSLAELPKIMELVKTEFEALKARVDALEARLGNDRGVGTGGTGGPATTEAQQESGENHGG